MPLARPSSEGQKPRAARVLVTALVAGVPLSTIAALTTAYFAFAALPPVPVPPENPITESKRVLGKILFWDEQLSTSNIVSCGSCHVPRRGGADPRLARHPGDDAILNTPDDILGSPGIIASDQNNDFQRSSLFALNPQITDRSSMSPINAGYAPDLFWDGRARSTFIDPETQQVAIAQGGGLESQAVGPPLNTIEMAHAQLDWATLGDKLRRARPLDLATNIPPDVQAVLAAGPSYQDLFTAAFGDSQITARRIAFALATYQRTLIADQTPWDRFVAGETTALTPGQQAGLNAFTQGNCNACHVTPLFTGNGFRNIGLRPPAEDPGRELVTGNPADRGRFKVPSLRNVGLRASFMHNGQFTNLADVIRFYARAPGAAPQFPENRDPVMNTVAVPPQAAPALQDFLTNGLTDPRVANGTFPFDAPTLYTARADVRITVLGAGTPGAAGLTPRIIAQGPGLVGSRDFRVGLDNALPNAVAQLAVSSQPPVNGVITPERLLDPVTASSLSTAPGSGQATLHWTLAPQSFTNGQIIFVQWIVSDPAAAGGRALSPVARVPLFCGNSGCITTCDLIDIEPDGLVDLADFFAFLNAFDTADRLADIDDDPGVNLGDLFAFLNAFDQGC